MSNKHLFNAFSWSPFIVPMLILFANDANAVNRASAPEFSHVHIKYIMKFIKLRINAA